MCQLQALYLSQEVQLFSNLRKPEIFFWRLQGHQPASEIKRSIDIIWNITITVNEVDHEEELEKASETELD